MTTTETKSNNPLMLIIIAVMGFVIWQQSQKAPSPTPTPDVEVKSDKVLIEGSTKAAKALLAGMAEDLESLAVETVQGKVKKVSEAAKVNTEADEATRAKFKAAMAELWKSRLGDGDLQPSASQVFLDTAAGFKKAIK